MRFYICHCGNVKENHNFKHSFENKIEIIKTLSEDKEYFEINAEDFPVITKVKCSFPQCNTDKSIHDTLITEEARKELLEDNNGIDIVHRFSPVEYKYREIKFILPVETKCKICSVNLEAHRNNKQKKHFFTTLVVVKNILETDNVLILDPEDEDIKIIWK